MPSGKYRYMYFKDYTKCHKLPYTVYVDFESFLLPVASCKREDSRPHFVDHARPFPCSFCYVILNCKGRAVKGPVLYHGKHVVETFITTLLDDVNRLERDFNKPLVMSEENERDFQTATVCHLCKKIVANEDKVRNHNHVTGEYLGATHNACNLNYNVPQHVPVSVSYTHLDVYKRQLYS